MRILSLSFGLAAIALVSAQQADPMAAAGAMTTYEWASTGDKDELVAQLEDLSYQISEQALRIQFLRGPGEAAPASVVGDQFSADGVICDGATSTVTNSLNSAKDLIGKTLGGTVGGPIATVLNTVLGPIQSLLSGVLGGGGLSVIASAVSGAISMAISFLKSLSIGPLSIVITPIIKVLETIQQTLRTLIVCKSGFGSMSAAQMFQQQSCYLLADIYRNTLADAAKAFAALPTDVSEDFARYLKGAQMILENASKTSVAATNEALMATRPVFSANVLEQYRMEIIRNSGNSDVIKSYAVVDLGSVVASSNGLEACLRIAADPAAAAKEADEEDDIDEDEDDDEDDDEDGDEDEEADEDEA